MSICNLLEDTISNWTREKADAFHNYAFVGHPSEDVTYIWEKLDNGWLLYRDIDAKLFTFDGAVHKLAKNTRDHDWESHVALFENTSAPIEIPIEYKNLGEFKYSVVQRPNNELGKPLSETIISGKLNEEYLTNVIDRHKQLFKDVSDLGKGFPVPPKWYDDSVLGFWADFKYWKYTRDEYITHYTMMIDKLIDNFNFDINRDNINKQVSSIWN